MNAFLEFLGVSRQFGKTHALKDVSLQIRRGEVFGLLGPSGCGKTTLLRIAGGFEHPDSGQVMIEGRDITHLPPNKRPVNTVFQNYALFPHMSVRDNISFGLRMAGRSKTEIAPKVERMLALIQMESHALKRPSEISGGQRQRVAIARALINEPDVLLLDEPLAALDLKLRQLMLVELNRIHHEVESTFLFVTHDQGEAMGVCDRIAVMNDGRIEQIGTPLEIYSAPATSFVASFIGDTNFLVGKASKPSANGNRRVLVTGLAELTLPLPDTYEEGSNVVIGLRPERIDLSKHEPTPKDGHLTCQGEIEEIIFLGSHSRYAFRCGELRFWAARMHHRDDGQSPFKRGSRAWMSLSMTDLQVVKGNGMGAHTASTLE